MRLCQPTPSKVVLWRGAQPLAGNRGLAAGTLSAQQARTPLFAGGMGETSPERVLTWRPRRNDLIFPDTRASGGMQVAAVIDELQAEVRKLKDVVAELRAEVDELKVRGARDEKDIVWVMEEIRGQRPPHVNIPTSGG